ncbi:MAG: hypothetical protein IJM04_08240 [Prevotella sp.]|nr:hypothetical protein [Prevotella sp.]
MEEKEIIKKWQKFCKNNGIVETPPSLQWVSKNVVELYNINGTLAKFNTLTGKFTLPNRV